MGYNKAYYNHATGIFRGLLCWPCNAGLGLFKDNPEFLAKAIIYLREEPANVSP